MPRLPILIVVAAVLATTPAIADVDVTFVNPDGYLDRDFRSKRTREATLNEFRRFFEKLGKQYLEPNETLKLEVLDIDLAGDFEPWRTHLNDVRIMRGITPPRFKLRYELQENGRTVASGTESITGMNYLMNNSARRSSERFAFEKDMLRGWFRRRFDS